MNRVGRDDGIPTQTNIYLPIKKKKEYPLKFQVEAFNMLL